MTNNQLPITNGRAGDLHWSLVIGNSLFCAIPARTFHPRLSAS
jgi:hypothetical protein